MFSRCTGRDGDQQSEVQAARSSRSGVEASVPRTSQPFQIQGPRIRTIPSAEVHAMIAYTLPVGPLISSLVIDTKREAFQPVYTLSNRCGGADFIQLMTAEYTSVVLLHSAAVRAMVIRRARWYAAANTPTTFVHVGTGPSVTTSTQVNVAPEQKGRCPFHAPNNAQRANTPSYNNPSTSSQMPSTVGDTLELTSRGRSFNTHDRLPAEAQKLFHLFALDPRLSGLLIPASRYLFSNWVPRDDFGTQQLIHSMKLLDYLFSKEYASRHYTSQSEYRLEIGAGDIPVSTSACLVYEREEANAPGGQMSTKADADSAAIHPSGAEPQTRGGCPSAEEDLDASRDCNKYEDDKNIIQHRNTSSRRSDTTGKNKKLSFTRYLTADTSLEKHSFPRAASSHLGVDQAAVSPAKMKGGNSCTAGPPLPRGRQGSSGCSADSGATRSRVADTDLNDAPVVDHQQPQISEAGRGGQKRRSDPNELSTPTAKKHTVVSLGAEVKCAPPSATVLPQHMFSNAVSVIQWVGDNSLVLGALSLNDAKVPTCVGENILQCDYLNSARSAIVSLKEKEKVVTTDERKESMLADSVTVIQKRHYGGQRDDHNNTNARQNITEECPSEMMAVAQQLREAISDSKEDENYVDYITSDRDKIAALLCDHDYHLKFDATNPQATEDENVGEYDDGP